MPQAVGQTPGWMDVINALAGLTTVAVGAFAWVEFKRARREDVARVRAVDASIGAEAYRLRLRLQTLEGRSPDHDLGEYRRVAQELSSKILELVKLAPSASPRVATHVRRLYVATAMWTDALARVERITTAEERRSCFEDIGRLRTEIGSTLYPLLDPELAAQELRFRKQ